VAAQALISASEVTVAPGATQPPLPTTWCGNILCELESGSLRPVFKPPRSKKGARPVSTASVFPERPLHVKNLPCTIDFAVFAACISEQQQQIWRSLLHFFRPAFFENLLQGTAPAASKKRLAPSDVSALVSCGVAEPCSCPLSFCAAFTVDELAKWRRRCIHHPGNINDRTDIPTARLPTLDDVRRLALDIQVHGDDAALGAVDFASFYYQFELPVEIRDYFAFLDENGNVFRLTRLPMGVSFAVGIAHFVSSCVAEAAASEQVSHLVYIDNIIFGGSTTAVAAALARLRELCRRIGLTIGDDSGVTKCTNFIGFEIDTNDFTIRNAASTTAKFAVVDPWGLATKRDLLRWFGSLFGLCRLCPGMLADQFFALKQYRRVAASVQKGDSLDSAACLWPSLRASLQQLILALGDRPKIPVFAVAQGTTSWIASDASNVGFGFSVVEASGRVWHGGSPWNVEEAALHINCKELLSLFLSAHIVDLRARPHVVWFVDNTTTAAAVRNGYSASEGINDVLRWIHRDFPCFPSRVRVRWVPSAFNPADGPSRLNFDDTTPVWSALQSLVIGWPSCSSVSISENPVVRV